MWYGLSVCAVVRASGLGEWDCFATVDAGGQARPPMSAAPLTPGSCLCSTFTAS